MKLLDAMYSIVSAEGQQLRLQLHPEHEIYQAHFPGNPITPGVCIVQIIGELLSGRVSRPLALSKITNLKFNATISPIDNPEVEVVFTSVEDTGEACIAKGAIMDGETAMTKFSLVFI